MAESCGEEGSSLLFRRGAVVVRQGWLVFALLRGRGVLQLPCLLSRCFHCAISCQIMFGGKLIAVDDVQVSGKETNKRGTSRGPDASAEDSIVLPC